MDDVPKVLVETKSPSVMAHAQLPENGMVLTWDDRTGLTRKIFTNVSPISCPLQSINKVYAGCPVPCAKNTRVAIYYQPHGPPSRDETRSNGCGPQPLDCVSSREGGPW